MTSVFSDNGETPRFLLMLKLFFFTIFFLAGGLPAVAETIYSEAHDLETTGGIVVDELEYRSNGSGEALAVWNSDVFYGSRELKARWLFEGEWAPEAEKFESIENRLLVEKRVSDAFSVRAGIRIDTPEEGPAKNFGIFGFTQALSERLELESNLYLGEDTEVLLEMALGYEILITKRLRLSISTETLFVGSEDVQNGIGQGISSTETDLRVAYKISDTAFEPYIGIIHEREWGDTAYFSRESGDDIEEMMAVIGIRLEF